MSAHDTIAQQVIDKLATLGIAATYEYPGNVVLRVNADLEVWTGGGDEFDYGTVNRREGDIWQPAEDITAEPEGLDENTSDPQTIATAWAAWVNTHRQQSNV